MCMFCAAVPTVLAVGTAARGKESAERKAAEARGETLKAPAAPISRLTGTAVTLLVVAAVINHTRPGGFA